MIVFLRHVFLGAEFSGGDLLPRWTAVCLIDHNSEKEKYISFVG